MTFKNFLDRNYIHTKPKTFSRIIFILLLSSFLFLIFSLLLARSLYVVTNSIVQKQNVINFDSNMTKIIKPSDYNPDGSLTYAGYYRNLNIFIPIQTYFYFALSFLSFLFMVGSVFDLFLLYLKFRREGLR
jgi:hypothetical protein